MFGIGKMELKSESESDFEMGPTEISTPPEIWKSESESDLLEIGPTEISTSSEILKQAASTSSNILPQKSKARYEDVYKKFMEWRLQKNVNSCSENVLLIYFEEISEKFKPTSLWATYSILRSMLNINDNIDIAKYQKLRAFLKRKSDGSQQKKSRVFSPENIKKFLDEAPDFYYLFMKTVLIMGVCGACRKTELKNIQVGDIKDWGKILTIKIPDAKTKLQRSFVISGNYYQICKKYINIRKNVTDTNISQFFLNYSKSKCTRQVAGINKIGNVPRQIAEFLKLPNPAAYTGHCFRRTSATIHMDAGGDIMALNKHGGAKSSIVVQQYVDDSISNNTVTTHRINNSIQKNVQNVDKSFSETLPRVLENSAAPIIIKNIQKVDTNFSKTSSVLKNSAAPIIIKNVQRVDTNFSGTSSGVLENSAAPIIIKDEQNVDTNFSETAPSVLENSTTPIIIKNVHNVDTNFSETSSSVLENSAAPIIIKNCQHVIINNYITKNYFLCFLQFVLLVVEKVYCSTQVVTRLSDSCTSLVM